MTNFKYVNCGFNCQLKYFGACGAGIIALKRVEVDKFYGALVYRNQDQ